METYEGGYGTDGTSFRQSTGTYAPLYARCLVIWEGSSPNAIVSIDALAIARSVHQSIRAQVLPLNSNWVSSDFVLAATHTHNGPVLVEELDPYIAYGLNDLTQIISYTNTLKAQIVSLVQTALAAPQVPVTLDYKNTTANFAFNREGFPYVETAVPVLVARRSDGLPQAILFGYGCHPVSAGSQTMWDGDYPAAACSVIEAAIPGCFAIFLTGAAGDQDPSGNRDWNLRNKLGCQLGVAVVGAASTVGRTVGSPINTSYQEVSLPLDITDTPANMAAVRSLYQARSTDQSQVSWYQRHALRMMQAIDNNTFATDIPLPLQVWRLQGSPTLRIAMVGGELVSGYAAYFRSQYNDVNGLFIASYANEVPGYIPSNEFLPPIRSGGSYAGGWDTDYPGIAGGSMTVYGCLGHFKAGAGGVESTLINALTTQLNG